MKILGLDVGSRRIGVAITDELLALAHPLIVLERRGTKKDAVEVARLCARHGATRVVIGLPLECDGEVGHRAERVRVLGAAIAAEGLPVDECDEQFSTVEAEETLIEADLSRDKRKRVIDRAAAQVILGRYLDEARADGRLRDGVLTPGAPAFAPPVLAGPLPVAAGAVAGVPR